MPDTIRGSRSTRHRRRAQGIGRFLAAICVFTPASAGAAEQPMQQPMQVLRALVLTAQSSIDQHQIASITVVCGVVLLTPFSNCAPAGLGVIFTPCSVAKLPVKLPTWMPSV